MDKVNSNILRKVIVWTTHYRNNPPKLTFRSAFTFPIENSGISEWDKKFLDVDQKTLFQIMIAANYLQIESLEVATCKFVQSMVKGKSPEELQKMFNMTSPEQKQKVKKEFSSSLSN